MGEYSLGEIAEHMPHTHDWQESAYGARCTRCGALLELPPRTVS